jgi:hypothetical protein
MNKSIDQHTETLDDLIFEVVRKYAKQHNLVISQESSYDKGKIVIFIKGENN